MEYKAVYPSLAEKSKGRNTCEYIVVHHTGTKKGTIKGVLDGLYRRPDYASCHYCVDTNGDVYKIGNDTDILWHAGVSSWGNKTDMNKYSIGIEVIGPMSDGGFTDEQRLSVKLLIRDLCAAHSIPQKNVLRHKDIAPGRKVDIADTFWNEVVGSWDEWTKQIFVDEEKIPEVSTEAKSSWDKAVKKGMVSDKSNPHDIPNNEQFQWLFHNVGVMSAPKDAKKMLQWFIVSLDRLGAFDKLPDKK